MTDVLFTHQHHFGRKLSAGIQKTKKALQALKKLEGLHPVYLTLNIYLVPYPVAPQGKRLFVRAGLLALGSTDSLRLPAG